MAERFYLPSLDGIRAVCATAVVVGHGIFRPGFPEAWRPASLYVIDGQLAVMTFFVLSGFLITLLLAREEAENGSVSLFQFYVRRFLRIVPVYLLYLGAMAVLVWTTVFEMGPCEWATALTYTKNYGCGTPLDGHLWSLSVEEQFYLVWPFVFALLAIRGRLVFAGALILAAPLFRVWFYGTDTGLYLFSFMTNMDALLIGSVVGLMYHRRPEDVRRIVEWRPAVGRAGAAVAVYAIWVLRLQYTLAPLTVTLGTTIQSLGVVYLIASYATVRRGAVYDLLNLRPVRYVGVLSYSLYVWQQPFTIDAATYGFETTPPLMAFPFNVAAPFLVAALSYHALEMPLVGLRRRFRAHKEIHGRLEAATEGRPPSPAG